MIAFASGIVVVLIVGCAWFTNRLARAAERRVPPVGRFAEVPGARLHFLDRGEQRDGPTIVMLHGLAGQLHNFAYGLVDDLAGDTRVIAVDRPGSGYSVRTDGGVRSLFEQADAIEALCRQLELGRVLLVGHSLGGALSLAFALRHPQRVAGLALIAPLTTFSGAMPAGFARLRIRSDAMRRFFAAVLATPLLILNRDRIMPQIFGPESVPSDYPLRAGGLLSLRPSQFVAASQDLGALPEVMPVIEGRYDELLEAGAPPISIIYGRGDRILDPVLQGEGFAKRVPRTRLVMIDGGHMLPVTQPRVCAQFLRDAWRQTGAPS